MPPGAPRNKPMDARMTAAESEPGVVLTQDIRVLAGLQRGTVNLSSPRAIFAGSPPRFTRSRVTYEAYAVSRTSTRPQVDSAVLGAGRAGTGRGARQLVRVDAGRFDSPPP